MEKLVNFTADNIVVSTGFLKSFQMQKDLSVT